MNWYLWEGKPLKIDGKIATHEDCCCPTTCECEPCLPPVACLTSSNCRLDDQLVPLSSVAPDSGHCRQFQGQVTLDCCSKVLEIKIRWINNATSYTDVEIGWKYDGGAWNYTTANTGSCNPFDITFNSFNLGDTSCCDHGPSGIVVRVHCFDNTCYCPEDIDSISGSFVDTIGSCSVHGQGADFVLACPRVGECRRLQAHCISIPGCSYEIDLALVWPTGGTDQDDVTLYWEIYDLASPGNLWGSGSATPTVPPSACDPLCFLFEGITLPSVCCAHDVEFHIGECAEPCCCSQFSTPPIPPLVIGVTGGASGTGSLTSVTPDMGYCAQWEGSISVTSDGDCNVSQLNLIVRCGSQPGGAEDLELSVDTDNSDCDNLIVGQLPDISPTPTCGPPFGVQWTVNVSEGKDCDCSDFVIAATLSGGAFASTTPTPSLLPSSVDEWLA